MLFIDSLYSIEGLFMITIDLLKNHQHHIPTLATIWCEVLGNAWVPSITQKEVHSWMNSWQEEAALPVGYVAFYNDQPVGSCALQRSDGIRPDLWPWLTDLTVDKAYQKQGVGRRLVEAIQLKARDLGYKNLYLFAFDSQLPPFYQQFGFSIIDRDEHRGLPVTVMSCDLK